MNLTKVQLEKFGILRQQFYEVVKPHEGFAPSTVLDPMREFKPEHLEDCRVLAKREDLIGLLPKGGKVAEVGTQEGRFARKLYDGLKPEELHLFDIDFQPFHTHGAFREREKGIHLHEGDSSTLLGKFDDESFDIIYIDGDHSYEGAKRDTEVAVRKLKPDGTLWFNDFTLWSPFEMIDYGVPYCVSEVCHSYGFKFKYLTLHPFFYLDVALQRIPG